MNFSAISPASAKRAICQRCLRPQSACICNWIVPVNNGVEVLILQQPLEVNNAKGSVRLLDLCLQRSRVLTGEVFTAETLMQALYAPADVAADATMDVSSDTRPVAQIRPVLLYPDTSLIEAADLAFPVGEKYQESEQIQGLRLVIIDATWRKSRKMLYLNPLLQTLPRLSLEQMPASHYRIRKAHKADQLSSLEACAYALMRLENDEHKYQCLLQAFDGFVDQQLGSIPANLR
ncbi:DTW domain-containing protein [Undibacterium sp. 14-3-2]|uniref:tRNA-uridine aminocarboxypropyltransferase n=1 Tax=Undibacterium sp. 14-3-2 TaxID=2800129 RepID=UPI0019067E0C|nr:tRNA-uridine aminocarboxypropyltransferase [Undibacterium sp. 14-3-2]MBK1889566.1 DTW domain-containing protein [Undibacterium sp. 14-3-2]